MKEIIVKQFYYGKTLREFLMVNKGVGIVQMAPLRKSLLKNWKKFAKQPLLTAGFLFYLFVYYSSSISGFIVAVMKDQ